MNRFKKYARYYNLIYKDKDYAHEADYVHQLLNSHMHDARTVLDLGCGTGRHDFLLAQKGYSVTGVDLSETMIEAAHAELATTPSLANSLSFKTGDMRNIRLGSVFDVVLSLFHVMSYQVSNRDLASACRTAKEHLKPGGLFIFDCWYGPAVLTEKPSVRVKRLEDDQVLVTRIAEPEMHPNLNAVDVNYRVLIQDKAKQTVEELTEKHVMRYLFMPEIDELLKGCGMRLLSAAEWMTGKDPGFDTWSVYCVAQL